MWYDAVFMVATLSGYEEEPVKIIRWDFTYGTSLIRFQGSNEPKPVMTSHVRPRVKLWMK